MSSLLSELAKLVSKGMGEKLDKEIMQEVQMNEKLTAEQRVLQELIDYQREYKEQTQDYAPGNRYWADKFMTIIGKAKQALTAHTEPEDEPLLHGELHGYVSPDCGCKYCEYGRNQIAQRKWDGFLEDTDYRELPDDMDIVDNLYRNWLQQENKTNGNH